jgi:prevent-host-death family protein
MISMKTPWAGLQTAYRIDSSFISKYSSAQHYMEKAMRTVTATDANRNFSGLLRDVVSGESVLIVSRGTPVAKISPVDTKNNGMAAKESLLLRLSGQSASGRRDWTRDDLYGE